MGAGQLDGAAAAADRAVVGSHPEVVDLEGTGQAGLGLVAKPEGGCHRHAAGAQHVGHELQRRRADPAADEQCGLHPLEREAGTQRAGQ
jgi:hypothetical protein